MKKPKLNLILASASPRRKRLLKEAGYRFRVVPSRVKELEPSGLSPFKIVKHLAIKKALAVSRKNPKDVVIGADTLVHINGHTIGKPKDESHARLMLTELSGTWQRVYSGVAVVWEGGKRKTSSGAVSYVKFRQLGPHEINRLAKKHMDKAGAYAVQEKKDRFVERIKGDYDNVVGFPMRVVNKLLRKVFTRTQRLTVF